MRVYCAKLAFREEGSIRVESTGYYTKSIENESKRLCECSVFMLKESRQYTRLMHIAWGRWRLYPLYDPQTVGYALFKN